MNVLQMLDNELKNSNWSLDEKKRHLYIRSCQLLTYDTRHYFVKEAINWSTIRNAPFLLKTIENNEIDLENMSDNRVYCLSWAKAYKKMQKELLNEESEVVSSILEDHFWLVFGHKADATDDSDLTRAKMKLCTYGYELSTSKDKFIYDPLTPQKLKKMDRNINYIKDNYTNFTPVINYLQNEFKNLHLTFQESLVWWIGHLQDEFFEFQPILKDFEDASVCISYLFKYFLPKDIKAKYECITLFDDSTDDWEFIDIYRIDGGEDTFYYALLPGENGYVFVEIPYLDVIDYVNYFNGPERELLLKKIRF